MSLSPLNFSTLIDTQRRVKPQSDKRRAAVPVYRYACPECYDDFDSECEAVECCQGPVETDPTIVCPICGAEYDEGPDYAAADCCLWKDFDAATRRRMLDAVDAGASWDDLLGIQRIGADVRLAPASLTVQREAV